MGYGYVWGRVCIGYEFGFGLGLGLLRFWCLENELNMCAFCMVHSGLMT
jgi:hypothetical protein